ncbi:MAG: hypothetical protein KAI66_18470, partial [Lentisphaeria bacterium]|nr:hypothetical protein [Lentisphaeria bacterium]
KGRAHDAIRFLGAALHYLQDCGSPPHAGEISGTLHRAAEVLRDPARIAIPDYCPNADFEALALADSLADIGRTQCALILQKLEENPDADILAEQLVCANACARACADVLLTFHTATVDSIDFTKKPAPSGVELLWNGHFEAAGDEPEVPDGWVMWWEDRLDDRAVVERRPSGDGFILAMEHVERRVACLPTWPRAIRCVPGQQFELSTLLEVLGPRAGLTACFHDDATRPLARFDIPAKGTGKSERITTRITAPEDAEILRVGIYAEQCLNPATVHSVSAHCLPNRS